ncbi:MAG: hypothetical protein V3R96_06215 [Dehalococcoidales bacterium]
MKKRLITISIAATAGIILGYLFILSWLLGLLVSKYVAGKSSGEKGRVRSIIIPFPRWRIHLHHWLYSLCLMGFSLAIGVHFLSPTVTYGLLGGSVFQGIYYYNDWHVIAVRKSRAREKRTSTETGTR